MNFDGNFVFCMCEVLLLSLFLSTPWSCIRVCYGCWENIYCLFKDRTKPDEKCIFVFFINAFFFVASPSMLFKDILFQGIVFLEVFLADGILLVDALLS